MYLNLPCLGSPELFRSVLQKLIAIRFFICAKQKPNLFASTLAKFKALQGNPPERSTPKLVLLMSARSTAASDEHRRNRTRRWLTNLFFGAAPVATLVPGKVCGSQDLAAPGGSRFYFSIRVSTPERRSAQTPSPQISFAPAFWKTCLHN